MNVEILIIGNELLDGRRLDTNSAWLGRKLTSIGCVPRHAQKVWDDLESIARAFELALARSDVVISTGGLGPTADDLTFEGLAQALGVSLVFHPEVFARIEARFRAKGLRCPQSNRRQALLPQGAIEIINDLGTAPAIFVERGPKRIFCLPGVPSEMKHLFERGIEPVLRSEVSADSFCERTYKFVGVPESHIEEAIESCLLSQVDGVRIEVAYTASHPQIDVTLGIRGEKADIDQKIVEIDRRIDSALGTHRVALNDETLEGNVVEALRSRGLRIAVAESITGGLITSMLVNVSGSSDVLDRGLVTYSNTSKLELLGVDATTIQKYGAVSEQCALEMARGAMKMSRTQVGLSTTGIAGPTGATAQKPVGLTYIAWVGPGFEETKEYHFRWDRNRNRMLAAFEALFGLLRSLKEVKANA